MGEEEYTEEKREKGTVRFVVGALGDFEALAGKGSGSDDVHLHEAKERFSPLLFTRLVRKRGAVQRVGHPLEELIFTIAALRPGDQPPSFIEKNSCELFQLLE